MHKSIPVYLVDNHHYFYRDRMYMFDDEAERFTFFCRAVLEMLPKLDWQPDVIHCNDWQSGPIPLFLKTHYRQDQFYSRIATVFTIHNLQYQGNYPKEVLQMLGLGDDSFIRRDWILWFSELYEGRIVYADVINTVSRTYATEIQRPELGERWMVLRRRSKDLMVLLTGLTTTI